MPSTGWASYYVVDPPSLHVEEGGVCDRSDYKASAYCKKWRMTAVDSERHRNQAP